LASQSPLIVVSAPHFGQPCGRMASSQGSANTMLSFDFIKAYRDLEDWQIMIEGDEKLVLLIVIMRGLRSQIDAKYYCSYIFSSQNLIDAPTVTST
jgi:hypothetical protein